MSEIDWAKLRAEAEAETIADKTAEILADPDSYECHACAIEGQPCDVGLAVKVERERIIKLLETRTYNHPEPSHLDLLHNQLVNSLIALIKGENK